MKIEEIIPKQYSVDYNGLSHLFEHSLSRVWQHGQKNGFALLSAFRGNDIKHNMKQHADLKARLKELGYGYFEVDGKYRYDDGTLSNELSVFVPVPKNISINTFIADIVKLGSRFNQESVLVFTVDNGAKLYYTDGSNRSDDIGSNITFNTVQQIYTKLKGTDADNQERSFAFEGIRVPANHIDAYAFRSNRILF